MSKLSINRFVRCSATGNENHKETHGGAVYLSQENEQSITEENYERLSDNTFIDCHSIKSGGAIFVHCYDEFNRKRSTRDIDDDDHKYVVSIDYSIFTECSSEVEGGAISSGSTIEYTEGKPIIVGTNDMKILECTFAQCQSRRGGALFFQDGDKEGDEETVIKRCHFYENYATGEAHEGYSISCRSYQVSVQNCDFHDHHIGEFQTDTTKGCIVYIETNEPEVQPDISNLEFDNINGVSGLVIRVSSTKQVVISNLQFNNIQGVAPCIDLDLWEANTLVQIEDSVFTNVISSRCVMSTLINHRIQIKLFKCQFENNSLFVINDVEGSDVIIKPYGGSVYLQGEAEAFITQCNFTNSISILGGGAIYAEARSIELNINRFVNCSATGNSFYKETYGGAVYLSQENEQSVTEENFEILHSNTFINCHSVKSGGAIFVYCYDEFNNYKSTRDIDDDNHKFVVSIVNSTFIKCSSEFEGGAISSGVIFEEINDEQFIFGTNDMHILECTFTLCQSGRGGALFFHDGDKEGDEETVIERCHFYECYADGDDHEGYSISCRSYQITIQNCDFYNHHIGEIQTETTKDCIVYTEMNEHDVKPEIRFLTFENITGVSCLIVKSIEPTIVSNLTFNNIADGSPCIDLDQWYMQGSLTIEYSNFTNIFNSRCIKGTTETEIFITTIDKCQFINNSISKTSGNEYFNGCGSCILCLHNDIDSSIEFLNCEFNGNLVSGNKGGAIWINSTIRCSIKNCSFINNTATLNLKQGHAICVDESSNFFITNTTFDDCGSEGKGSAINLACSKICIENCTIQFSQENNGSRGIEVASIVEFELIQTKFIRCHSKEFGGGLFIHINTSVMDDSTHLFNFLTFEDCSAQRGSAIQLIEEVSNKKLEFTNCTFKRNKSLQHGGSLSLQIVDTVLINNCLFEGNIAFSMFNDTTTVRSLFEKPEGRGGSIFVSSSNKLNTTEFIVENCSFRFNAAFDGYGIYIEGNGTGERIIISGNMFIDNYKIDDDADSTNDAYYSNRSVIASEKLNLYDGQIETKNTFINSDSSSVNKLLYVDHYGNPIIQFTSLILSNDDEFTEPSKSSQFSNSQLFTSSLNFCESTLLSETFTPSQLVIYSNSFTLTFIMRRSVSFSNSYFYSSTYSLSYIEELGTYVPIYYETLFQSYFPYIINFYSPSYVATYIELSLKKKKGITQEQLIGVTCGAVSVFFFIVWMIIIVIRKKNKIINQYNEYDDISDSIEEEQEGDRKIDQEKDQIQEYVNNASDNSYDENFWLF